MMSLQYFQSIHGMGSLVVVEGWGDGGKLVSTQEERQENQDHQDQDMMWKPPLGDCVREIAAGEILHACFFVTVLSAHNCLCVTIVVYYTLAQ